MKKIYLDNAATTQVDKEVIKEMMPYFTEKYGNASSLHNFGKEAKEAIEKAREKIARFINAEKEEIIFTSGGTESDNLAIKGLALANPNKKHIITSKIEHPAILETCKEMQRQGYKIDYISVDKEGIINLQELKNKINPQTLLVSIMHVNNEIGTIEPIEEIAKLCHNHKVPFHTDAVQSFGKLDIDVKKQNIDSLSASAHKIYGSKGIGFLYKKRSLNLKPILNGGGHENDKRSGTENVPGIVGMAKAVEICKKINKEKIKKLRNKLLNEILKIDKVLLNGSREKRIYNNINVSFLGVEGESLVLLLDKEGVATSTGSACSSHKLEPSHVLRAIGRSDIESHGSLRITFGKEINEKDINYVIKAIKKAVQKLREISPFK